MKKLNKMLNRNLHGFKIDLKLKITVIFLIVSVLQISANTYAEKSKNILKLEKVNQENIEITGTVLDENNVPLPAATIMAKGYISGTLSDIDGKFKIHVPKGTTTLVFSYTGYEKQEVLINDRTIIDVKMVPSTKSLDEVVVVGYGTQRKKNVVGAVSTIKADNMVLSSAASAAHALEGKVAGLQITQNSAQPGGGIDIQIRGAGSVNASNEPLIVVDGFPITDFQQPGTGNRYDGGSQGILNSFNPNDIASIDVLKDAASCAIYGAQAANGVILITTKKGADGKIKIEFSNSYSFQAYNNAYHVLDLQQWMQVRNDAARENWDFVNKVYPYSDKTLADAIAHPVNGIPFARFYSDQQIADAAGKGTNWLNLVTRDGMTEQNNLSVSGGSKSTKYFLSGNTYKQEGVMRNSAFNRNSFRFNIDQKVNDYLSFGVNTAISKITNQNTQLGGQPYENSGIIRSALQYSPNVQAIDALGNYPINPDNATQPNPYSLLTISDQGEINRNLTNFYTELRPIAGLVARVQVGTDQGSSYRYTYLPVTTLYGALEQGKASIASQKQNNNLLDFTLTYNKKINANNSFSAMLGYSHQNNVIEAASLGNTGFITDAFLWNNMNSGSGIKTVGSSKTERNLLSYFARITYAYKDRYFLTSNIRRDGASVFSANNKYGIFPSIALGWDVAGEPFMKSLSKVVSQFKLRASWGQIGNANIDGLSTAAFYAQPAYLGPAEQILTGVLPSRLENPDLKWETTTEKNLGLDFEIINRRVSGSIEVYDREVSDLLNYKPINSYNEVNYVWANVGSTDSKGVEVTLNAKIIDDKDFKWRSTVTYSKYRTNWKQRAPDFKPSVYENYNDPVRAQYSYLSDGIMQIGESVPAQPDLYPGQIKSKDVNGYKRDANGNPMVDANGKFITTGAPDGKIDQADIVLLGSTDPKFVAGFSNYIKYKNFTLNFHFTGNFGRRIVDQTDYTYGVTAVGVAQYGENALTSVLDRWTPQNPSTTRPASHFGYSQYDSGDFFLQDASFIRLQNVSLSYKLPAEYFGKYFDAAIRLEAQNLFLITKYKGVDPETDGYTAAYPNVKTFTVGLDLKF
jgi:TonB-linked SusC/RagA family outer membrane protein